MHCDAALNSASPEVTSLGRPRVGRGYRLPDGRLTAWRQQWRAPQWWNPTTVTLRRTPIRNGERPAAFTTYKQRVDDDRRPPSDPPRPPPVPDRRRAPASRAGGAGGGDRSPLRDRSHEAWARFSHRGPRDARRGHETASAASRTPARAARTIAAGCSTPTVSPRRSAIKPGGFRRRFGVTIGYLVEADELQIRFSQGSKPARAASCLGPRSASNIAELRHSTLRLASSSSRPPPHHDIYSIEDLKQLVYDLRCATPSGSRVREASRPRSAWARVRRGVQRRAPTTRDRRTRLRVPEASPVYVNHLVRACPGISGFAEAHKVLVANSLLLEYHHTRRRPDEDRRDCVVGRPSSEPTEMGFSTAPLIATGCIMMRVCHHQHLPCGHRTQTKSCGALRRHARPCHHLLLGSWLRRCAASWPASALRLVSDLVGRVTCWSPTGSGNALEGTVVDLSAMLAGARAPTGAARRRSPNLETRVDSFDVDIMDAIVPPSPRRSGAARTAGAQRGSRRRRREIGRDRAGPR